MQHVVRAVVLLIAGGAPVWYFGLGNGLGLVFGGLLWLMAATSFRQARQAWKSKRK